MREVRQEFASEEEEYQEKEGIPDKTMGRGILLILILFLILFMDRPLRGSCLPSRLVCFLNTERLRIESRNAFTVTGRLKETKRLPLRMMDRDDENTTDEEGIKLSRE